ncbi:MAG: acetyl-CoA carboxylase biotin carboxyl carrier protein subunit [Flavobacteriales bacterium]|nr:MAG: acetyl-CoA carboxylase biotin carboxyl carrier protein subunit [Flavobacteriales bacterium]
MKLIPGQTIIDNQQLYYICPMLKLQSGNKEFKIEFDNAEKAGGSINGKPFSWDLIALEDRRYHVIKDSTSYTVEVTDVNFSEKTIMVKVNGNKYELKVSDRYDELLKEMGMDVLSSNHVKEIKAPMPGMVLDVMVQEGKPIKKGEPVLVLEAMKMENILKSPVDGVVKKVKARKGQAVEKNEVLVNF